MRKGERMADEQKLKIGMANKGREYTPEMRRRMSQAHMGNKPTEATREKMRKAHNGKMPSRSCIEKARLLRKGMEVPIEVRRKISRTLKGNVPWNKDKKGVMPIPWNKGKKCGGISGQRHWNWQGGITKPHNQIRVSLEYKLWRRAVLERDNYTCRFCGQHGGKLCVDHIKPFAMYPELRLAIDNGRTLCHECHKKTPTYLKGRIQ